jgi:hypothetical protein
VEAVVLMNSTASTHVAVAVTTVEDVGSETTPLSKDVVPHAVLSTTVTVPLTGCVTALPSIFNAPCALTCAAFPPCERLKSHGVVFGVFPGCIVQLPDCVAETALPDPPDWLNCPSSDPPTNKRPKAPAVQNRFMIPP